MPYSTRHRVRFRQEVHTRPVNDDLPIPWDSINAEFSHLANELLATRPDIWWSCEHGENQAFPFWAYASFGRSRLQPEEEVVVSLSFKYEGRQLAFTSDIALADGKIVADGPGAVEPIGANRPAWIEAQVSAALAFIRLRADALARSLS